MVNKKIFSIAIVVFLTSSAGFLLYRKASTSKSQIQYIAETAEKGTLVSSVTASGNIIIDKSATVDPTISGTVTGLNVKLGDKATKGQILFTIINDQLDVSVSKSYASYRQAKNEVESAKLQKNQAIGDYYAAQRKKKNDPESYTNTQIQVLKDKINLADSAISVAEESLSASYKDYLNQKSIADKRNVTAPISGVINEINIKDGDDLGKTSSASTGSTNSSMSSSSSASGSSTSSGSNTNQSPIIIGDLKTLKATVAVNEVDISKVKKGQKVMLKFDALDGTAFAGKVQKISSLGTVSQGVVTYDVTIKFDIIDRRIKPEMSVSASIITNVKPEALIIPNSALKSDMSGNYYVEILKGQNPVQSSVEIGAANNKETEILKGINAGDKVITQTIDPNASMPSGTGSQQRSGFGMPGAGGGGGIRLGSH